MLLQFSVQNFLSFKEKQTLNLYADSLKEFRDYVHIGFDSNDSYRLLKSMAIHGHNSHGKSNFFKAFKLFNHLILNSFIDSHKSNNLSIESYKLNSETKEQPSTFEIEFIINQNKYRYLFVATNELIIQEELHYSEPKIRENFLFKRRLNDFSISKVWNKENKSEVESVVRFAKKNNILFLSVLFSQEYISHTTEIYNWISKNEIITNFNDQEIFDKAKIILDNQENHTLIDIFIDNADLGFNTYLKKTQHQISQDKLNLSSELYHLINYKNIQNFDLATTHSEYNKNYEKLGDVYFDMRVNESSGTVKYFILACFLTNAIRNRQLILIDELDSQLHPDLLDLIIKIFNSKKWNMYGSQLIFSSHNTYLLDKKLRRDQLTLIEKNVYGESSIGKAHTSKKPIRTDKSIEKEYLKGELKGVSKKIKNNLQGSLFD